MKLVFTILVASLMFTGCSSETKKEIPAETSEVASAPALPPLQGADVIFMKKGKELARVAMSDSDTGITATFSSEKLVQGRYIIHIEEACSKAVKSKTDLPPKMTKIVVGEFKTGSGNTSSEFKIAGMSVGDRFVSVNGKAVTLSQKNSHGAVSRIACSMITKP